MPATKPASNKKDDKKKKEKQQQAAKLPKAVKCDGCDTKAKDLNNHSYQEIQVYHRFVLLLCTETYGCSESYGCAYA